ncbi:transcriptional regulator (plasmid) [Azospirillum argentinense]|uniref:Transcriptional regulator n=3 Tax=Azospirillum TaxID=191 RepID=A0A235H6X4_AZOBR|nr:MULTISPECIES: MucR family transcriptional regulator [Azospirillum]AIB15068.1 transcriptional regulator [Azospirillum argentinense]AWJ82068.1 transcriptional regulator [Azospirillum sp. TSH58]EZQ04545.1 MucR family transcriptional regulator [Azospirillum argentinense]KAA1057592.1 Transcriptional regulator [Azospirillum argentinense]MBK3801921.1 transcriptional regulator [Azospirillum argentinense]
MQSSDTDGSENSATDLVAMTGKIVASYVRSNQIAVNDLPNLIRIVHQSLSGTGRPVEPEAVELRPAVPVKKSVMPDYIVCLEDGKKLKMLKRYLRTAYGMTPDEYRRKWGLPADYPMTAPNYAEQRSAFAKSIGLGKKAAAPAKPARRGRAKNVA